MSEIAPLESLGRRIVIMGPSNAGKSTLAEAIGHKTSLPVVHLDQLHHTPYTDWHPRPAEEFLHLQRAVMEKDAWVIDGNYSALLPERLARATGAIIIDDDRWRRLIRYFRRTLSGHRRAGALEGTKDRLKWSMIEWILLGSRYHGPKYRQRLEQTALPFVYLYGLKQMKQAYATWNLPDFDPSAPAQSPVAQ